MANYNLAHSWQQVDDAVESVMNGSINGLNVGGVVVKQAQTGAFSITNLAAGASVEMTIAFPTPFSSAPHVICAAATTVPENITVSSGYGSTVNGCSVTVHNNNAVNKWSGIIHWIAMG